MAEKCPDDLLKIPGFAAQTRLDLWSAAWQVSRVAIKPPSLPPPPQLMRM